MLRDKQTSGLQGEFPVNHFVRSQLRHATRHVCLLAALILGLTAFSSAGLTDTATQSWSGCPTTVAKNKTTYSNWIYTDSAGVQHPFGGSDYKEVQIKYVVAGHITYCGQNYTSSFTTNSSDGLYTLKATGSLGSVTMVGYPGHVNPKFIVMGVTYAPPGHASTVSYQNSTSLGTTTASNNSFSSQFSESISVTGSTGNCDAGSGSSIIGFSGGVCVTGTESTSYTQQSNSSNSISVVNKSSIQNKTTGTPNDFAPVDHDYDLIWLWLNPISTFTYYPALSKNLEWDGYGYDMADQPAMDIWPVLLGYLNGNFKCYAIDPNCDPEDAQVLARSWVTVSNPQTWPTGEGPGLTMADLANIAKADPWGGNPNYVVTLGSTNPPTTTDGRFTIVPVNGNNSQSFAYKQAGPGNGSGLTQTYTNENTTTNTVATGNTYTFQQAFGLEEKVGGSFFWQSVQFDFKQSSTFTWTHSHLLTTTNITDSTDTLSITGPPCPAPPPGPCNPAYAGFPEFDVYQDNLFGSFMFWGIN